MMDIKRILIIDDEVNFGRLIKLNLELTGGFKVSTATSGRQGIELAKKVKPDLILLDIFMPEMDGFETLERLKKDKDTTGIPVVMLTAKGDEVSMTRVMQLCGKLYITKPIESSELKAKIEWVLKRKG